MSILPLPAVLHPPERKRTTCHPIGQIAAELYQAEVPPSSATLELIRKVLFPPHPALPAHIDLCLVLGSHRCEYRARKAFSACKDQPVCYIASGGGLTESGETEAAYMRSRLHSWGVTPDRILIDESSNNTAENLRHALPLIESVSVSNRPLNLILVTGGFHLVRTMALARQAFARSPALRVFPLAAHGPNTAPDSWHLNPTGRLVIGKELEKVCTLGLLPPDL